MYNTGQEKYPSPFWICFGAKQILTREEKSFWSKTDNYACVIYASITPHLSPVRDASRVYAIS